MRIVVIGGTGLIGSKLVTKLGAHGHDAIAASPNSGVNTLTGEGLADILVGADVVVDVSNSPSFEDAAVLDFFTRATTNILAAESTAGVGHHVALSVVGTERLTDSGYMRAKVKQEQLIKESKIPYSIVHATQFFEFFKSIAGGATSDDQVRLSSASIQPVAADEVASAVARVSVGAPLNGTVEIGGPEVFTLADFVARGLEAHRDPRTVVIDDDALYFGARLADRELLPSADAQPAETTFQEWLAVDVVSGPKP
ncbi:NmrA family transcriptional regulator [Williamsia sp. 1138]|uniref:SDR family oxidoreductase n=1 Tax=Williamsia sp. 1138 TaxID=1903117 RepID=UPI000A0FCAF1|nr:SDR family oxidoreductase [Williamsia sp. 1138]OZG27717.1 NmrA family transcriptional regulator [Williamsia sp. 1138]